jgi:hypothetical protein
VLTDDDLTRELGAAFRAATADLSYTGRTRPPRRAAVALPATAAAVAVTAVAAGVIGGVIGMAVRPATAPAESGPTTAGPATAGPATAHSPAAKPSLVTETVTLAGFRITYQRTAGRPSPVIAELVVGGLPPGAREVHLTGTRTRAWAGRDPRSGDNALYLRAPARTGGRLFVLLSATWSQKRLIGLVAHPRAVPLVSPSHSGSQG